MAGLLLEVVVDDPVHSLPCPLELSAIRGAIDEALVAADLGEVAGVLGRDGSNSIDVELDDESRLAEALVLLRRVLKGLGLPAGTPIYRCEELDEPAPCRGPFTPSAAMFDPSWSQPMRAVGLAYDRVAS